MNELITAAKAVIDGWDNYGGITMAKVHLLRAAVERAENPPADYNAWTARNSGRVLSAHEVWIAAQQSERERIKNVVAELLDPTDPWIHYSTLLERIDGPDDNSGEG